jgi:hypothetical protein
MMKNFINSEIGQIVISIILGVGLAAIFRKVCNGSNCVVIQGPKRSEIEKYYYKLNDDCYKYSPYPVSCDVKQSQS